MTQYLKGLYYFILGLCLIFSIHFVYIGCNVDMGEQDEMDAGDQFFMDAPSLGKPSTALSAKGRAKPQCKFDPVKSTTGTSGLSGFAGGRGINVNCDIINTSKGAGHPDSVGITSYNLENQVYTEMPYKTNYTVAWDSGEVDTYQAAVYTNGYGRIAIGVKVYYGVCISTFVYGENYYKTPSCTACDTVVRDDSFITQKITNSVLRY